MNQASPPASRPYKRRQYLIDPGFQWKHAGAIALAVFLLSTTVSAVLYGVLHQQARMRAMNPTGYTAEVTTVMICFGVGFAALTAGGVGLWSIIMTHRICGPLFVLKRYLRQITQGQLPSVRPLRRRDEFKDLYEAFDEAVASLRSRTQRELMQLDAALEAANQVRESAPETLQKGLESIVSRIEWLRSRAQEALAGAPASQTPRPQTSPAPSFEVQTAG